MRIQCTCRTCGGSFTKKPVDIKRGSGIFCSRPCHQATLRHPIDRLCDQCGRSFTIHQSTIDRGSGKYCSRSCYYSARTVPIEDRFWDKVNTDGPILVPELGACWPWTANRLPKGYGVIGSNRNGSSLAHRLAWKIATGEPVPDGFDVCHVCDNPPCVRNDDEGVYEINGVIRPRRGHLFLGTVQDNGIDSARKNRAATHWAKLTQSQVIEIRAKYAATPIRGMQAALAREHNVSRASIADAINGVTWKHI